MISERALRWRRHDPFLVKAHFACARDTFDAIGNPGGYVNFGTAENQMLFDRVAPLLRRHTEIREPDAHYNELHGARAFREAIARFLSRRAGRTLSPDGITVATGASGILEMLSFALCDPGDAILAPAPYYSGFDHDLGLRAGTALWPVSLASPGFTLSVDAIAHATDEARTRGLGVRALLINSPQNPLGQVYGTSLLREIFAYAAREHIHVIADEIYAESLLPGVTHATALADENAEVSVVYGFAKDFGLSGFKVGIHYSDNSDLVKVMQDTAYFHAVSMQTQRTLTGLLEDPELPAFLDTMRARLSGRYVATADALSESGIPHLRVEGGIVMWLDLRHFLTAPSFECERALYEAIFSSCRVSISPGQAFHCPEPGWFRLCFTMPQAAHSEGLRRLTDRFSGCR